MLKLPTQYFHTCAETTVSSFKADPIGRAVGLSTDDVLPDFVFMKCVHTMCGHAWVRDEAVEATFRHLHMKKIK